MNTSQVAAPVAVGLNAIDIKSTGQISIYVSSPNQTLSSLIVEYL